MADEYGYVRKRKRTEAVSRRGSLHRLGGHTHAWCPGRPSECHVRPLEGRGDVWVCPECKQVWIGVLRPSLLDAVPHWSVKWKRMCPLRAVRWRRKWERNSDG